MKKRLLKTLFASIAVSALITTAAFAQTTSQTNGSYTGTLNDNNPIVSAPWAIAGTYSNPSVYQVYAKVSVYTDGTYGGSKEAVARNVSGGGGATTVKCYASSYWSSGVEFYGYHEASDKNGSVLWSANTNLSF